MDLYEKIERTEKNLEDYKREISERDSARVAELSLEYLQNVNLAVNILLNGLERDRIEQRNIVLRQEKLAKRTLFCAWCALIVATVSAVITALSFIC